jgi:hypothetical protein
MKPNVNNNSFTSAFNTMTELLDTLDEQLKLNQHLLHDELETAGFNDSIVDEYAYFTKDQMEAFTPSIIMAMYQKHKNGKMELPEDHDEAVKKIHDQILDLYESCSNFITLYNTRMKAQKEMETAIKEYGALLNSEEMKEREENSYNEMKKTLETSTDPNEIRRIKKTMEALDDAKSMNFLVQRLDQIGDKEIKSIMGQMFDPRLNAYIYGKYESKMKQLKYKPEIYTKWMDIEELFCGKSYYPYNNLFLFVCMRYIAHADMYDNTEKYLSQTLISKLTKLIYHSFGNVEEEKEFIDLVKMVDDKFSNYKDEFLEKNDSNPDGDFRKDLADKKNQETLNHIRNIYIENGYEDIPEDVMNNPDGLKGIVEAGKNLQEYTSLKAWFKQYNIPIGEDETLEQLKTRRLAMKDAVEIVNRPEEQKDVDAKSEALAETLTVEENTVEESTEEDSGIEAVDSVTCEPVEVPVELLGLDFEEV